MTLVEILVVVAVIVPVVLAATLGLFTAVTTSEQTGARQEMQLTLSALADGLRTLDPYVACGTAAQYDAAARTAPGLADITDATGDVGRVVRVEYWNQGTGTYQAACTTDGGAQRLVLRVTRGDRTVDGEVVKRNPDARPAAVAP